MSLMMQTSKKVIQTLRDSGFDAVLAGGCVRDLLLKVEPKDFDIATNAKPEDVKKLFKSIPVGESFGVCIVLVDDCQFEVATFRNDGEYLDGRRPSSVEFSSMEEDAKRRDLTINGMFMDQDDQVIDFVGGKDDLQKKIIRFIGDPQKRIDEDRLRMLRAVRFALKLGFEYDPQTWEAIKSNAHRITDISVERIREELTKMLRCGKPRQMLEDLRQLGLLKVIMPEIVAMKDCEQNPVWHPEGDVWEHTIRVLEGQVSLGNQNDDELMWATLLHDVGKPVVSKVENGIIRSKGHAKAGAEMTSEILTRMKFSNDFIDQVRELVYAHMTPFDVEAMKRSTLRKFLGRPDIDKLIELARADCIGTEGNADFILVWKGFIDKKLKELRDEPVLPERFVKGRDLIELGYKPGPVFKEILSDVFDRQLEDQFKSREDAIEYVKSRM